MAVASMTPQTPPTLDSNAPLTLPETVMLESAASQSPESAPVELCLPPATRTFFK